MTKTRKVGLIGCLLAGVGLAFGVSGCANIQDYRGKPVGQTTANALKSTGESYSEAGKSFYDLKVGRGLYCTGEGLVKTLGTALTGINDGVEFIVGAGTEGIEYVTSPIPVVKYAGSTLDGLRKTTFDSTFGGETFNDSFNIKKYGEEPLHFLTADFEAASEKHENDLLFIVDGTYKTLIRFGSLASLFAGGGGGGGAGEGPGPTPPDPGGPFF